MSLRPGRECTVVTPDVLIHVHDSQTGVLFC